MVGVTPSDGGERFHNRVPFRCFTNGHQQQADRTAQRRGSARGSARGGRGDGCRVHVLRRRDPDRARSGGRQRSGHRAHAARDIGRDAVARRISGRLPARGIGAYLAAVAILNALVWLRTAVPESLSGEPTAFLADIGLTPWGFVIAGAILTYGVFEAVGVACDQWFGYRADPDTSYASLGGVWLFAGLAIVALAVAVLFLANVAGQGRWTDTVRIPRR
jgi:hypothetical protein